MEEQRTEVVLVGAGPIGIEMAIALKERQIPYMHFDKGQAGQMIINFPVETRFFSSSERLALGGIPIYTTGQQKCSREEYLSHIRSVINHFGLVIHTYEEVCTITRDGSDFIIGTVSAKGKRQFRCGHLILATGGTSRPRRLGIPGEDLPHVSVKLLEPHLYFQKKVVVIGGKNSAAEATLRCHHVGAQVAMVVRQSELTKENVKYWILPEIQGYINSGLIDCYCNSEVVAIHPGSLDIMNRSSEKRITLEADFIVKAIGFDCDMHLFRQVGVTVNEEQAPLYDPTTMETNVPNVFSIGTATGGTQLKFTIFIENCHDHIARVMDCLSRKRRMPTQVPTFLNRGGVLEAAAVERPEE